MKKVLKYIFLVILLAASHGCAYNQEMVKEVTQPSISPVMEEEPISVESFHEEKPDAAYILGPNDVLFVSVYGKPELGSILIPAGNSRLIGSRIDGFGNIYLPLVGSVNIAGLTVDEARLKLQEAYKEFIKKPSVVVEIADYQSKPIYLIGQFRMPGTYFMDRPMTLIQGISLGKGLDTSANYRGARILREGKILPVDIYSLFREGDITQDIWLKAGDTIYVPDVKDQKVFLIGAVKQPGQIPMIEGNLTLLQALSIAGFDEALSYSRYIRIIRSYSQTKGALIVVDLKKIVNGEALDFDLAEGDVVHVAKSPIGNWNVALGEIVPTLQAIGAVLNPFVQIKYLGGR